MKAYPVYKCKRCGKIEVNGQVVTSPEEIACVAQINTHICDVSVYADGLDDPNFIATEQIGIMELVGYNEIPE